MWTLIKGWGDNLILTVKWVPNTTSREIIVRNINVPYDPGFMYDHRWIWKGQKLIPLAFPTMALSGIRAQRWNLGQQLTLEPIDDADGWEFEVASSRRIRNAIGDRYIDHNVKTGGKPFLYTGVNATNQQWMFDFSVPTINFTGYSFGRIMHNNVVQFIFQARQYLATVAVGSNDVQTIAPSGVENPGTKFVLENVGSNINDPIIRIKTNQGTYVYTDGTNIVHHGTFQDNSPQFLFRIIRTDENANIYRLQSMNTTGTFVKTVSDMWSNDMRLAMDSSPSQWTNMFINVLVGNDYKSLYDTGKANPRWCCGVEYGDNPLAKLACSDLGWTPSTANCDGWMTKYCNDPTHKDEDVCACLNSTIPWPQCLDANCTNKTNAYKSALAIRPCGNIEYTDCRQIAADIQNMGKDAKLNIHDNKFQQICGNKFGPDAGGGGTKPDGGGNLPIPSFPDEGPNTAMYIIIFIILIVIAGLTLAFVYRGIIKGGKGPYLSLPWRLWFMRSNGYSRKCRGICTIIYSLQIRVRHVRSSPPEIIKNTKIMLP